MANLEDADVKAAIKAAVDAAKAHTDLMEKGQALLDDPNFDIRLKVLVSEEMENSRKCMEVFVRTPENN